MEEGFYQELSNIFIPNEEQSSTQSSEEIYCFTSKPDIRGRANLTIHPSLFPQQNFLVNEFTSQNDPKFGISSIETNYYPSPTVIKKQIDYSHLNQQKFYNNYSIASQKLPYLSNIFSAFKKKEEIKCDLLNLPQMNREVTSNKFEEDELSIKIQIPERKGEKMIFYLRTLKEELTFDLNCECQSMGNKPPNGMWLTATLWADFKNKDNEVQKVKLSNEEQVKRSDDYFIFKNGQASVHLNVPVTRRSLSSTYSNLAKPIIIYVSFELYLDNKRIGKSNICELPYKDGKVKRESKKLSKDNFKIEKRIIKIPSIEKR